MQGMNQGNPAGVAPQVKAFLGEGDSFSPAEVCGAGRVVTVWLDGGRTEVRSVRGVQALLRASTVVNAAGLVRGEVLTPLGRLAFSACLGRKPGEVRARLELVGAGVGPGCVKYDEVRICEEFGPDGWASTGGFVQRGSDTALLECAPDAVRRACGEAGRLVRGWLNHPAFWARLHVEDLERRVQELTAEHGRAAARVARGQAHAAWVSAAPDQELRGLLSGRGGPW